MTQKTSAKVGRRAFIGGTALAVAGLAAPALAMQGSTEADSALGGPVRSNVSSFRMLDWQDYFANTKGGAILCDTKSRALHYWSEDQSVYRLYPTSVPLSDDLTRLGKTEVIQKVENPPWRPTASMRERIRNGPNSSKAVRPRTRWAFARSISRGPLTAFMARMTHARSGGGRRMAASACTTSILSNCST